MKSHVIEKALEAARFAPSEHNTQTTEFVVIRDKAMIHKIGALTAEYYAALARRIRNPIGKAMFRLMAGPRSVQVILEYLPDTHKIYGVLAMGYPRVRFRNWPERNPAEVTWFEAA